MRRDYITPDEKLQFESKNRLTLSDTLTLVLSGAAIIAAICALAFPDILNFIK